nr:copper homeostasis protein CutC [Weissella diestrammenae]
MAVTDFITLQASVKQSARKIRLTVRMNATGRIENLDLLNSAVEVAQDNQMLLVVHVWSRNGDYQFDTKDVDRTIRLFQLLRTSGVQCVSFAALNGQFELDRSAMIKLIEAAGSMQIFYAAAQLEMMPEIRQKNQRWLDWYGVQSESSIICN